MEDGEVLFPSAPVASTNDINNSVNPNNPNIFNNSNISSQNKSSQSTSVKSIVKNWKFWVLLVTLYVSTLIIYSDVFINDALARFPSLVTKKDAITYQTNCKGALIQGGILLLLFSLAYFIIYAFL